MSLLSEVKRRKIFQVAAVYLVVAWLIVQIIVAIEAPLHLPDWVDTLVIVLLAVGFPITLIFSWGFNLTSEGLVRDRGAEAGQASITGKSIEYVLLGLLGVAVAWLVYRDISTPDTSVADSTASVPGPEESTPEIDQRLSNSIAVLPFENLSPDPDNAYFAAGIHESTTNQLAKIRDVVVVSRRSVLQYETNSTSIIDIAEELKVEKVMEGSVRYADGRVLISAKLIDGRSGLQIWSETYEEELTDIFRVQGDVAEKIASAMHIRLLPEDRRRISIQQTESREALQFYLTALSMPRPETRPEYADAWIASLKRAISIDPEFVEPNAELAIFYMNTGNFDEAGRYARRAIQLDPMNGRGYAAQGSINKYYYDRQEQAKAELDRAVELSPNDSLVLANRCYRFADDGQNYSDYLDLCRRAVDIAPTDAITHRRLAAVLARAGEYAEALDHLDEAIEINPVASHEPYVERATVLYLNSDPDGAKSSLNQAVRIMSSNANYRVDYAAYLYGLLHDVATAQELIEQISTGKSGNSSAGDENIGWGLLGTRDKLRALNYWSTVVDEYTNQGRPVSPGRMSRFRDNWLNDPMLEEPEFLELRRRLGYGG